MRVSTMIRISSAGQDGASPGGGLIDCITEFGRQVVVAEVRRLEEALVVARTRRGLRGLFPVPSTEGTSQ